MKAAELATLLMEHPDADLEFSIEPADADLSDGRIYARMRDGERVVYVADRPNGRVHLIAVMLAETSCSGVAIRDLANGKDGEG